MQSTPKVQILQLYDLARHRHRLRQAIDTMWFHREDDDAGLPASIVIPHSHLTAQLGRLGEVVPKSEQPSIACYGNTLEIAVSRLLAMWPKDNDTIRDKVAVWEELCPEALPDYRAWRHAQSPLRWRHWHQEEADFEHWVKASRTKRQAILRLGSAIGRLDVVWGHDDFAQADEMFRSAFSHVLTLYPQISKDVPNALNALAGKTDTATRAAVSERAVTLLAGSRAPSTMTTDVSADCLKPSEVAAILKVSKDKVYTWIRNGKLPAFDVSKGSAPRFRITKEALEEFQARQRCDPLPRQSSGGHDRRDDEDVIEFF